ncbi:MAG: AAA family ATPase, partial [Bacilli bacterium]|nr:AAA family ATPase [Bacilli bacterium]
MTFIGEQASGKSTIAKIVFLAHFFPRLLSLYAINLMSFSQKVDLSLQGFQKEFERCIRERMPGVETGSIVFAYSNDTLKATAIFTKKEVKVDFNEALSKRVNDYISTFAAGARNSKALFEGGVFSVDDFEIDEDVCAPFYFPAGRGALLSISEQIQGSRMIPSQDEFALGYIRSSVAYKHIFKSNASTIQKWRNSSRPEKRRLFELLSIVLKGGYEQDSTGNEFLRVEGKNELVEVRNASSGQQEILYPILFLLDEIIHPRKRRLIIFEEPEAHLHPKSQKAIVELIAYVANHSPSRFLITTHSPYILSAFNPLILSGQIEKKGSRNPIVYP